MLNTKTEAYYNPKFNYKLKRDFEQTTYVLKNIDGNVVDTRVNVPRGDFKKLESNGYKFLETTIDKTAFDVYSKEEAKHKLLLEKRQSEYMSDIASEYSVSIETVKKVKQIISSITVDIDCSISDKAQDMGVSYFEYYNQVLSSTISALRESEFIK